MLEQSNKKMLKYILIILFISSFGTPIRANQILDKIFYDKNLKEYVKAALYVVHHFISPKTNTLIITEKTMTSFGEQQIYHDKILHYLLHHLNDSLSIQLYFSQPEDRPWDYNLFIVDSWSAFQSLLSRIPTTKHEREYFFFIILTRVTKQSKRRNLHRIFKLCIHFHVKNVVVMTKLSSDDFIRFDTYKIFAPNKCHRSFTTHEINRYQNGKMLKETFFLQPFRNFHGCSLNVAANILEPLLTFNGNRNHTMDMTLLGGIEGDIIKLMAKKLNFKINLRITRDSNEIRMSTNSSGCFAYLEQHLAQIAIGGLSSTIANNLKFSRTFAYYTTPYVFVVHGGVLFGAIKQLLNPLNKTTWIFLAFHLILSVIGIHFIERRKKQKFRNFIFGPKNKYPMRNMITIYLGNPVPAQILPKRNFARFILMAWLLLTFEIRNGYQGKMFDSLRLSKRIPVPAKLLELIDMDYTLLSSAHTDFYPPNKTTIMLNPVSRFQLLQSSESRLTSASVLDYLGYYNFQNYNTSTLTHVDEKIYAYQCVMYFNKHSILRESFDRKLKLFMSSGIISHIAKQHARSNFYSMNTRPQYIGKITHRNLQGLYYIYVILCQICLYTFILELLTRKSKRLLKIMDWLN